MQIVLLKLIHLAAEILFLLVLLLLVLLLLLLGLLCLRQLAAQIGNLFFLVGSQRIVRIQRIQFGRCRVILFIRQIALHFCNIGCKFIIRLRRLGLLEQILDRLIHSRIRIGHPVLQLLEQRNRFGVLPVVHISLRRLEILQQLNGRIQRGRVLGLGLCRSKILKRLAEITTV